MENRATFMSKYLKGKVAIETCKNSPHWRIAAAVQIWSWCSAIIREDTFLAKPGLHVNPYVSMSKNLQHALRYALGLKKYVQGSGDSSSPSLDYGKFSDPLLTSAIGDRDLYYKKSDPLRYVSLRHGNLLGAVATFCVPENESNKNHIIDVERLHEEGKLWIDPQVVSECEVCFYGFVEREYEKFRFKLLILNWNDITLSKLSNSTLYTEETLGYSLYGFTHTNINNPTQQGQLQQIRQSIDLTVKEFSERSHKGLIQESYLRALFGSLDYATIHEKLTHVISVTSNNFNVEQVLNVRN